MNPLSRAIVKKNIRGSRYRLQRQRNIKSTIRRGGSIGRRAGEQNSIETWSISQP